MKFQFNQFLKSACVVAAASFTFSAAQAQTYPSKPITMVVPFPAGSATDAVARLIGLRMSEKLGQPIVMENVAGASGTIAAARVARAQPDGQTLLIHTTIALSAALYKNLSYDTATAFEPIGMVNTGPYVFAGNPKFRATDAKDFFAILKSDGNKVAFANAGVGTGSHLCAIMLSQALGVQPNLIPYKSTNLALQDVIAGHVHVMCDQTTNALPHHAANKIKVFAITSPQRSAKLPDVPTTRELGAPQVDVAVWHGLYAPKGTPAAIVQQVNAALQVALADPDVQKRLSDMGTDLFPADQRSPAAHAKQLNRELVRFRELAKNANLQLD
ncbi:tripartite tricarboxylate transporter substrate-binding protein [Ramlibacter tataouinensis]|uniref:Bug family tripartite tricarboxylate transporter substrate binding protein n=1 Tax=Ramlibacter tataouinensis TaxID=94132 RepID=UPI0022F3B91B|nr:tripartite tricarboxylate transporter substrate-binding protein [Ramlibacter tataouinensis]WBY03020.1 tripartite tricarboxylate transporter substrate-binding protein [Ramlibacter tataouinensis]